MFDDFVNNVLSPGTSDVFGASALYTANDLSSVDLECRVILEHDVMLQPSDYTAQVVETGTTITSLYSETGKLEEGDTFIIDDETYTVSRMTDNDKVFVTAVVNGN